MHRGYRLGCICKRHLSPCTTHSYFHRGPCLSCPQVSNLMQRTQLNTVCNTAYKGQTMFVLITAAEQRNDPKGNPYTVYKLSLREVLYMSSVAIVCGGKVLLPFSSTCSKYSNRGSSFWMSLVSFGCPRFIIRNPIHPFCFFLFRSFSPPYPFLSHTRRIHTSPPITCTLSATVEE